MPECVNAVVYRVRVVVALMLVIVEGTLSPLVGYYSLSHMQLSLPHYLACFAVSTMMMVCY